MRTINLLLQRPERKKYRKLRRWGTLYGQIYGPKLVASNFVLEPWSLALGGYFTRHGQRSGATRATLRLLKQLYQGLRGLRGEHRWVLQLAEDTTQSHQRPEFLYSHLRQRFPHRNIERQKRWIRRLRRRALLDELRRSGTDAPAPIEEEGDGPERRLRVWPTGGTLSLASVVQLPRLALLRHTQLQLWWETPQPLLTATRYLQLNHRLVAATRAHPTAGRSLTERRHRIYHHRAPTTTTLTPVTGLTRTTSWVGLLGALER